MTTQKLFLITALLIIGNQLNAQYVGGMDDGSDHSYLHGSRLSGEIASFSVLYQGSSGDGFDKEQNQVVLSNSSFDIYHGSSGDGFSQYIAAVTVSGSNVNTLYYGDSGDGHSQDKFQTLIDGDDLSMLFKGNTGDGADYKELSSVFLQGFMNAIFEGGDGDGFAILLEPNNYLSGLMLTLFNGGDGDGFAVNKLTSALTLDLIEQLIEMDVLLYPNPANHIVNIKPNTGIIITAIEVYDIAGKAVHVDLSEGNTINVSSLSDGMYLLNIISESGALTKKLIVKK
ncbi:MAG: T9SS type A sorting domain-containing protein [Algibacter sp.]|uniref:T9SS type A sorting domain-containing protein n=1 Tax=Algibacter sp. TaxID=1872428 RepID=UPI0032999E4E